MSNEAITVNEDAIAINDEATSNAAALEFLARVAAGEVHSAVVYDLISCAILAERKRAVVCCDYVSANITNSITGRKRFDIYDMNRQIKGVAGVVKDHITADFSKWRKPEVEA